MISRAPSWAVMAASHDVAIAAIETGAERITDEALNRYKRIGENEATFQ